jgi:hypothetical protein
MSWTIQIYRAKPNPAGKDRAKTSGATPEQLLAEWVDLKNIGDQSVTLSWLNLSNFHYDNNCKREDSPTIYWTGESTDVLGVGKIVRVHTGRASQSASMLAADRAGADLHVFANRGNFILNNKCGDVLGVWYKSTQDKSWLKDDGTYYDPNPGEGAVLVRTNAKLA